MKFRGLSQELVLQILSFFDRPVRLGEIVSKIRLLEIDSKFKTNMSLTSSLINFLRVLEENELVQHAYNYHRTYWISDKGLSHLASHELQNEIYEKLLEKRTVYD